MGGTSQQRRVWREGEVERTRDVPHLPRHQSGIRLRPQKGLARRSRNQMSMMLPFGRNLNASYSPPRRGGEAAPSRKCREATKGAQTGWSVRLAFEACRTDHPVRDKSERIHGC